MNVNVMLRSTVASLCTAEAERESEEAHKVCGLGNRLKNLSVTQDRASAQYVSVSEKTYVETIGSSEPYNIIEKT